MLAPADSVMRAAGSVRGLAWLRALAVVAVLASFFYGLDRAPLFDLDEGAFSEATREMLARGDLVSPYLNGEPRFDKPAFIHWLQAASASVFGFTEFGLRLPSAVCGALWALITYLFVRKLRSEREALYAATVTATALLVTIIGKAATADALLNLLIAATMFSCYLYFKLHERKYLYWTFAAAGLGFLAKGPVAVAIPLAVSFFYCAVRRDLGSWFKAVFNPAGILLFLVIALPWYAAQYAKQGDAFIQGFFFKHNVGRFANAMEGHRGGLWYYVPVVLLGTLPYTSVLLKAVRSLLRRPYDDYRLFCALWFGLVFVLFSLSATKLPHYLLYGSSGLFALMAINIESLQSRFWSLLPAAIWVACLLAAPTLVTLTLPTVARGYTRDVLSAASTEFGTNYYLAFGVVALFTLYFILEKRIAIAVKLLCLGVALCLATTTALVPVLGKAQQEPVKQAALLTREKDLQVVMWGINMPSFNLYSERVTERREPRPGDVVVTKSERLPQLKRYETLYQKDGIALVRVIEKRDGD